MSDFELIIYALSKAAAEIERNSDELNRQNVFPVADGDTGTNLSHTFKGAAESLKTATGTTACEAASAAATAMLKNARGNSGVILSLWFRGFAAGLSENSTLDSAALTRALTLADREARNGIEKPVEGTVLSVARAAAEGSASVGTESAGDAAAKAVESAESALEKTRYQLPQMKKAGVTDAAGAGLLILLRSIAECFSAAGMNTAVSFEKHSGNAEDTQTGAFCEGYCVEFILRCRQDPSLQKALRDRLLPLGDCLAVIMGDDICKIHLHTLRPDKAIGAAIVYGNLYDIKIDNLTRQIAERKDTDRHKLS